MIGTTISHYKILEELGRGGMGDVYKAEDTKLKRTIALKFLSPELTRDAKAKQRFIHEAQAASALDHANIGAIYEIDETEDGQMFIAMAYYEGGTLQDKIESREAGLPFEELINIATQIAQGLAEAHSKEIVHRDIKPANIMITEENEVKIVDFGLAKLAGRTQLTKTGATMGTVAYMSPEQAEGMSVDHRTDIWSLAVVLYEMLTGQQPFKGEYEIAVLHSIMYDQPDLGSPMPIELRRIIEKGMAKKTEQRFQAMDEMLSELRSLSKSLESGELKKQRIVVRLTRKQRAYLYRALAGLVVLILAGALYMWQHVQRMEMEAITPSGKDIRSEAISLSKNRIAVLPLANISPDPQDKYFADGMTEELTSTLSKIGGLRVIARTSVMQYKSAARNVAEIGRELNVGTVLEGSVRKARNLLRITVQLIDTQSQEHLWAQDYDRELKNVFAIQSDIAQRVAEAMKVQLATGEKRKIEKKATENLEAYFLYLKGRHQWHKRTEEGFKRGFEYFKKAIEIDSNYALAYSGLADSYTWLGTYHVIPAKEAFPRAKETAMRALTLDDQLAEAHTSLAIILRNYDWNWLEAEREFKRAIKLNSSYATAHKEYAFYLAAMGRSDEAIAETKDALELDPLSFGLSGTLGIIFYWTRYYDQAIEQLRQTIDMRPDINPVPFILNLNLAYVQKGVVEKAISELNKARARSPDNPDLVALLGYAYGMAGKRREAHRVLNEFKELVNEEHVLFNLPLPMNLALIYIGLGEKDQAFEWLERAYAERAWMMVFLKTEPYFDPLRSDPRFSELLKKMGLDND